MGRLTAVIDAVLFDYGDTLMQWVHDDALVEAGHRAGLAAIGRPDLPEAAALSALLRERWETFFAPGAPEEIEYPEQVRAILREVGAEVDDEELGRFLEAEHAAWQPARRLGAHTHALLESLRARGLRLALVSNAFDPPWLLHRDLEQMGLAERLDFAVFSSEVGRRKPDRLIFETALAALGLEPGRALFVGDRLYEDVGGAAALGMKTMLALWFRVDEDANGAEPDYQAFTQHDVLNVVRRLNGEP